MSEFRVTPTKESGTPLLENPTRGRRRQVLAVVLARSAPTTERELAAELAGRTEVPLEKAHVALRHVDLPKLSEAGFVAWDRDDGTVAVPDQPAFVDARLERAVASAEWDGVPTERRRTVLGILRTRDGPLDRDDIAREVAASRGDGEPSTEAVEQVALGLHHVDLPKLERAGLIEYDADDGEVSCCDHRLRRNGTGDVQIESGS